MSKYKHNCFFNRNLRHQLGKKIHEIDPDFAILETADPKLKILTFITYFLNMCVNKNIAHLNIDNNSNRRVTEVYMRMLTNQTDKNIPSQPIVDKINNLSVEQKKQILQIANYSETLAALIQIIINESNLKIDNKDLPNLINLVILLFLINYHTPHLALMAKKNLDANYQNKVEFIIVELTLVGEIHKLLKRFFPGNINDLVIVINRLLEPIQK